MNREEATPAGIEGGGLTLNQVVAYNLHRARTLRGWTQHEAAERLAPHLGVKWSNASYSAAERSITGERVRQFTADDIYAFAKAFDLALTWFFLPPPNDDEGRVPVINTPAGYDSPAHLVELLFELDDATADRLGEMFAAIPPDLLTPAQIRLSRYAGTIVGAELKDLVTWRDNLRDLASLLDHVSEQALERSTEGAHEAGRRFAEENTSDKETHFASGGETHPAGQDVTRK